MAVYDTLSQAVDDLGRRGYEHDFSLGHDSIRSGREEHHYYPDEFSINEVYRFEGPSSTDDESVVYAVEADDGTRGVVVDAYGTYADSLSVEMIQKLRFRDTDRTKQS